MEKPKYIFEGSGAPEAKLKPRDTTKDLQIILISVATEIRKIETDKKVK